MGRVCPSSRSAIFVREKTTFFLFLTINSDNFSWELNDSDLTVWEDLLRHAVGKGLDDGVDAGTVIDELAELISQNHCPTSSSCTRVADILLSHLDMGEVRQAPDALLNYVNNVLIATYPPNPRNTTTSIWLIRSLTRSIDTCPSELLLGLLEILQDSLCTWISDDRESLADGEYSTDVGFSYILFAHGFTI